MKRKRKNRNFFKSNTQYNKAFDVLKDWGGFNFKKKKGGFTSAQKSAISRRAKAFGPNFRIAENGAKDELVKYDFIPTTSRPILRVAKQIWGDDAVNSKGFVIPRAGNVQRGIKTITVKIDSQGNISRRIFASKRRVNGREFRSGSWEVYIPVDEERLVVDELRYVMELVAPYVTPTDSQRAAFPDLDWSREVRKGDNIKRWGLMLFNSMGLELSSLQALLNKMQRYIFDAIQNEEDPMKLNALIGVRP